MKINDLELPLLIQQLMNRGLWKLPEDRTDFKTVFGKCGSDAQLYAWDYMSFENGKNWLEETDPVFIGNAKASGKPGNIDPKQAILIGDIGLGYDQPIALDYSSHVENQLW